MKKHLLLVLLLSSLKLFAQPCNMQGVYTIGTGGGYPTLTSAFTALRTNGVGGPVVLELLPTYVGTGETFPVNPGIIPCISASRNVTVRPQAGANNLALGSFGTVFSFANTRYVKIDGRPGGTGSTSQLSINGSGTTPTILFINGAQYDTLQYVTISGSAAAITTGVVSFSTSTTTSNSYNAVLNASIVSNSAGNCVYALGSTAKNSYNTIANCELRNYTWNGVLVSRNNTHWTIDNNSFYHTGGGGPGSSGGPTSDISSGINIDDSTSGGFVVTNNFVGGSAPQCGGTRPNYSFKPAGIRINAGRQIASSIQNNTISNIRYQNYASFEYFVGIEINGGKINCGNITGNTVGSTVSGGAIQVFSSLYADPEICGIRVGTDWAANSSTFDTIRIQNNKIGGIVSRWAVSTDYVGAILYGIKVEEQATGFIEISYNLVGSTTISPSMDSYNGTHAKMTGIYSKTANSNLSPGYLAQNIIHHNELVNLQGTIVGIDIQGGKQQVYSNTLRKFYADYGGLTITGISVNQTAPGTLVKGNNLHTFILRDGYSYGVQGINVMQYNQGCRIEGNLIHAFQRPATWSGGNITGIYAEGYATEIVNNMIRLGRDSAGNVPSLNPTMEIAGMTLELDSAFVSNNTVYMDGAGDGNTNCIRIASATSKPKWIINNVLVNNKPCVNPNPAFCYNAPLYNSGDTTNLVQDYNIYASGASAPLVIWSNLRFSTISTLRTGLKRDQHSMSGTIGFVNGSGGVNSLDLHLSNPTPAEGTGMADSRVPLDFDNQPRAASTPADIGADAGNYSLIDIDVPVLTHGNFLGAQAGGSNSYDVRITDNGSGLDTAGSNEPRMWLRKKHPTVSSWFSFPGALQSGNLFDGSWNFAPDLSSTGLTLNGGDSLEYYFVAQDKRPLLGYSNVTGTNHTSVHAQVTPPTSPLRLLIIGIFPDTIRVGAGEMYTSLTNEGGFFQACRRNLFPAGSTNIVVYITSDLTELGTHRLELLNKYGPPIHFKTPTATLKQVRMQSGSGYNISIFNSPNVHFDGSVNGSGRYLLFGATHTNPLWVSTAVSIIGKIGDVSVNSCIFESNSGNNYQSALEVNANDTARKVRITHNLFRDATIAVSGLPKTLLAVGGSFLMDSFIVRHNEFTNFGKAGVSAGHNHQSTNEPKLFIDSNHFYYTTTYLQAGDRTAIDLTTNYNQLVVTNNFIGGTSKFCGGNRFTGAFNLTGITLSASYSRESFVLNNTIQNINLTDFGNSITGIRLTNGLITVKNNLIGHPSADSSLVAKHTVTGVGGSIGVYSGETPTDRIEDNTIAGAVATYFYGINFQGRKGFVLNNRIYNAAVYNNGSFHGMKIWLDSGGVQGNVIYNLKNNYTSFGGFNTGVDAQQTLAVPNKIWIAGNRIYGLSSKQTGGGYIAGIRTSNGEYHMYNNQVSLDDAGGSGNLALYGMYSKDLAGNTYRSTVRYNTVLISGSTTAAVASYAFYIDGGGSLTAVKNNLFYNQRTSGLNKHLAVSMVSTSTNPITWVGSGANNNLFVTADTSRVNEWKGTVSNIFSWRNNSGGDSASFAATAADVPSASLFADPAVGNLNINVNSPLSWYVNGKGIPQAGFGDDFDSTNLRSTAISNGPTDIGSDEFNTATAPPVLSVYGRHQPGGADTLAFNGRIVAILTWGNTGTLPTLGACRWYSGRWPNDPTNNGTTAYERFMSGYFDIPATGGSGYTYSLRLFYDSSMLGKVLLEPSMVVNKRQSGVAGSWTTITPTAVNVTEKSITINNQSGFSEFTATDAAATLPIKLLSFIGAAVENDVQLQWQVAPGDEEKFVIERSLNGRDFAAIATVPVTGQASYSSIDAMALMTNPGLRIYYRLKMVAKTGEVTMSRILVINPRDKNSNFLSVAPNPFDRDISLTLRLEKPEQLAIVMTDATGRIVFSSRVKLPKGLQTLRLDELGSLPAGSYMLKVMVGDEAETIQLLKR